MKNKCHNCGDEFEVTKNNETQKFCSRRCYRLSFKKKKEYAEFESVNGNNRSKGFDLYFNANYK